MRKTANEADFPSESSATRASPRGKTPSMPTTYDYLLLGGGTSCAYAAVQIRSLDKDKTVAIVGAENEKPYDRPPFTKYYLWNDDKRVDDFHSKDESFYPENHIDLHLGSTVTELDRATQTVRTADGREFGYRKLLYALGSEPRRLPFPEGEIWVLRTAEDSTRIRSAATNGAKATLIGAGYIGAELAASLVGRGCAVTLIERGPRCWPTFPSTPVAEAIGRELERLGVRCIYGTQVSTVRGTSVGLATGEEIAGDFVVAGIGATPRVDLARASGLQIGARGVATDETLRSSDPNIWVAGDDVEYPNPHTGAPYRTEHHLHAKATAEHCGRSMAGEDGPFTEVPMFFSDVGEQSMNLRGYPEFANRSYVVTRPDDEAITEVFLFSDGRIAGVVDLRKDWKSQEPLMTLFADLIQKRANASALEPELQPGFDVERLAGLTGTTS